MSKSRTILQSSVFELLLKYLGLSSSIRLIKSVFSIQPSHVSSQSFKIFFKSRTFSFFRFTVLRSICFSETKISISHWMIDPDIYKNDENARMLHVPNLKSHIWASFFFNFSHILSAGIDHDSGLLSSPKIPVADSSNPPR